jgi:hypothetical protein
MGIRLPDLDARAADRLARGIQHSPGDVHHLPGSPLLPPLDHREVHVRVDGFLQRVERAAGLARRAPQRLRGLGHGDSSQCPAGEPEQVTPRNSVPRHAPPH